MRTYVLLLALASTTPALAQAPLDDRALYEALRDRALTSDWAYARLADLTDTIGPRLSGSPQAQAAVEQVARVMRADGLRVTLQPMRAPHWVRGREHAELVEYPQRPAEITQTLHVTALGGSIATPPEGISAPVLVVRSFAELTARAKEARGKIVVYDVAFDRELAQNGLAGPAYGQLITFRRNGASAAAKLGAVASLVRSIGGAEFRLPHTGNLVYEPGVASIPAGALAAEDAALIARLAKRGPVRLKLQLDPQTLPDVESFNVLGDLLGSEKPEEIVLISGHLDSWDLGTGALDDGAGVAAALAVAHLFKELKLRPKRTLRVVAWMSEETGLQGARAYFEALKGDVAKHMAVFESDFGAGRPYGIEAYATAATVTQLQRLREVLAPL
ncbi:MAG TPA: M20/M25/M40 family metallo-hydrolase, partial [Polyangiales bacterium]|nr:M20/M25/M40 family metallo-hydrolase [Polyangiales bacterium]